MVPNLRNDVVPQDDVLDASEGLLHETHDLNKWDVWGGGGGGGGRYYDETKLHSFKSPFSSLLRLQPPPPCCPA